MSRLAEPWGACTKYAEICSIPQSCDALYVATAAAGLYYLAEVIEEYTILAKRVITYLLVVSFSKFHWRGGARGGASIRVQVANLYIVTLGLGSLPEIFKPR